MKLVFWNIGIFALLISSLELTFWMISNNEKEGSICHEGCGYMEPHNDLGSWHKPNTSHDRLNKCGENICYRVRYSFDSEGRRSIPPIKDGSPETHLLMLGGSFAFGEGAKDEQTIAYHLQNNLKAKSYNYGFAGGATSRALYFLESKPVLKPKKGVALYYLLPHHLDRVSMNSLAQWQWKAPAYQKKSDGTFIRNGFQEDTHPLIAPFIKTYYWLKNRSYFLSFLELDLHILNKKRRTELLVQMLKNIQDRYENNYSGKFYVVFEERELLDNQLKRELKRQGLKTIPIPPRNPPFEDHERYVCPCDRHFSAIMNQYVSSIISDFLKGQM